MNDTYNGHTMVLVVDPVDHSIGAMSGTVPIGERWAKSPADALWIVEQRSDDEVIRRESNRLW